MDDSALICVGQGEGGQTELVLNGQVNVFLAASLHQEAVRLSQAGGDVRVCCEGVDSFDASALQVLVALQEALAVQGKALQCTGFSQELLGTVRLTGLDRQLVGDVSLPERTPADPHEMIGVSESYQEG